MGSYWSEKLAWHRPSGTFCLYGGSLRPVVVTYIQTQSRHLVFSQNQGHQQKQKRWQPKPRTQLDQSKMRLKGWLPNSLKSRKGSLLNSLQNRKGSLLKNVKYSSIKHQTQLNTKHQKTLSYLMKEVLFWSIFLFSSRSVPSPEFWTISQKLEYTLIREGCQKKGEKYRLLPYPGGGRRG